MGKTTNFDPEKAAEQRKAEMKDITEKLEKGVQDVFGSEQFQNLLDTMAKFPHYSVNNKSRMQHWFNLIPAGRRWGAL